MVTLCSGAGIWKVSADIPVYSPPKIRFNWNDGTGWQEVEGTDFSISQEGDSDTFYVNYCYTSQNTKFNVTSTICQDLEGQDPINLYTVVEGDSTVLYIDFLDAGELNHYRVQGWSTSPSATVKLVSYAITEKTPINSGSGSVQYRLKIYNGQTLVYDQAKTSNPSAQKIDETCAFNGNYNPIYSEINLDPNAFLTSEINGNTVTVKRCVGLVIEDNQISSNCSQVVVLSGSCAPPKIRANQEPLCPPGTCPLQCGDSLCCYNEYGISVRSYSGGVEV